MTRSSRSLATWQMPMSTCAPSRARLAILQSKHRRAGTKPARSPRLASMPAKRASSIRLQAQYRALENQGRSARTGKWNRAGDECPRSPARDDAGRNRALRRRAPGAFLRHRRRIAAGIPRDLLRRRPDVRLAGLQAAAQSPKIGVAVANMLPSFSLSGAFGSSGSDIASSSLSDLFTWQSKVV